MTTFSIIRPKLLVLTGLFTGCEGRVMDSGNPADQFGAHHAAARAPEVLKQKVRMRGKVRAVHTSSPKRCVVGLERGVTAHSGEFAAAAAACRTGELIHPDGIVKAVEPSGPTLDPAFGRAPSTPFQPLHP